MCAPQGAHMIRIYPLDNLWQLKLKLKLELELELELKLELELRATCCSRLGGIRASSGGPISEGGTKRNKSLGPNAAHTMAPASQPARRTACHSRLQTTTSACYACVARMGAARPLGARSALSQRGAAARRKRPSE